MTKIENAHCPWDLTTIQRLLMQSFQEGAKLAAADADVRNAACHADDLEEAFFGASRGTAQQTAWRLSDSMATRFPGRWSDGLAAVITSAVEAALVLGARAIARVEETGVGELSLVADDELWLSGEVDLFLVQVVEALLAAGHPVPGAQAFLDRTSPAPEPDLLEAGHAGSREVRTTWIRDADTGQVYQWCVRQTNAGVMVASRLCGSTETTPHLTVPLGDLGVLLRMMREIAA